MKINEKYLVCHLVYEGFPVDQRVRRYVNAINEQGMKCIVICSKFKRDKLFENWKGNRVYRLPISKKRSSFILTFFEYLFFSAFSSFLLLYLGIRFGFKIIHVHSLPDLLVFAALLNKIFGTKIILDLHEIFPELYMARTGAGENSFRVRLIKFAERISIKFADRVLTIHDNARDIFISRNKNIEDKITVVMNGVDPAEFKETEHVDSGEFIIMYNGTINKILNLTIIIKALSLLRRKMNAEDFRKIKFKMFGDGPSVNEILGLAEKLDLKNIVEHTGFIPPDEMHKKVLTGNLLILPPLKNIYSDLFYTVKLVEMIYLRVPVIATRLKTYRLFYGENSLFYFDSGNEEQLAEKIKEVYYSEDLVRQKTENAFNDYQKVSWGIMKERYLKIINGLLK